MKRVNLTELRNHLPGYLAKVRSGEEILITSRGRAVARLLPVEEVKASARKALRELRKQARIGDVTSPLKESWDAIRGNS